MATTVLCCGFECGVNDGGNGSGASHWRIFTGSVAFNTGTVRNGSRSLRINPTAGNGWAQSVLGSSATWVFRVAVRFAVLPTSNVMIATVNDAIGHLLGIHFRSSTGTLHCSDGSTFAGSGIVVSVGTWYVLDCRVNLSAATNVVDGQVNGVALTQFTLSTSATTATDFILGHSGGSYTADMYFDDLVISQTIGDYPYGNGKVLRFLPNADGTHTSTGTNIVKGTTGTPVGAAIVAGTTDAWQWVDDAPIGSGGTLINQQSNAAAEYVEIGFENTVEVIAPRAVGVIVGRSTAGFLSTFNVTIKFRDNLGATDDNIIVGGGIDAIRYHYKTYGVRPAALGVWTLDAFNDVRVRYGFSSDALPDTYLLGAMLEVEFAQGAVALRRTRLGVGL